MSVEYGQVAELRRELNQAMIDLALVAGKKEAQLREGARLMRALLHEYHWLRPPKFVDPEAIAEAERWASEAENER